MITIRDIRKEDVPAALEISLAELGTDYLTKQDFLETIHANDKFCMIALDDGILAGFAICQLFGPEKVDEMLKLPNSPDRDSLLKVKKIGLLDSVSVSQKMKGKGVGRKLGEACYKRFQMEECNVITAMAWEDINGHTNIKNILEHGLNMTPSIGIKGYWNLFVSSPEGHHCPMCGAPCKCYGRLYSVKMKKF